MKYAQLAGTAQSIVVSHLNWANYSAIYLNNILVIITFHAGLATVIRHRQDDDQRSSHYDELLSAETRAAKNSKGVHSKKEAPTHRISEVSGTIIPFVK